MEVYTIVEIMEMLNISRGQVYKGIKEGDIPSLKIGKRLLVSKKALDALLEAK